MSTYLIWQVLHEAGHTWQASRSWCETGQVKRKRQAGVVTVTDPDAEAKNLIQQAYTLGEAMGLAVWCQDEAGPYQTRPHPGASWQPEGEPVRYPSEYVRDGTAKLLTLFHPADSELRVKGVVCCPNMDAGTPD